MMFGKQQRMVRRGIDIASSCREILVLLEDLQRSQGFACITQTEIAERLDCSLGSVSNKFKLLMAHNYITKVRPGVYLVKQSKQVV